jgi:hypothetical protein
MIHRLRTDMAMDSRGQLVTTRLTVVDHLERKRTVTTMDDSIVCEKQRRQHRKLDFDVIAPTDDCLR